MGAGRQRLRRTEPQGADVQGARARLLDVAERLFAGKGVAETSVRDITSEAGANVSAVNYYFGSREGLLREVVSRRAAALNDEQLALLDGCLARAGRERPSVECLIHALAAPALRLSFEHPHFARLLSRLRLESDKSLWADYRASRAAVRERFHEAFGLALPELDPREIATRVHYVVGAIHHVYAHCPLEEAETPEQLVEGFVAFYAAAMRAPAPRPVTRRTAAGAGRAGSGRTTRARRGPS
jgi:AcrR family transcriptional regulator